MRRLALVPAGCAVIALFAPPFAGSAKAESLAAPGTAPVATILDVQGPVTWHARLETAFRDARGGESLFAGAVVQTGAKGYAHLAWRNGGDFKLLPLSELAIPEEEGVLLNAGKVWAQFQHKLLVPFFFKSPSATAVVRGTTLGVELMPDGGTTVAVLEGRVEVLGQHGEPSRMLEPGQSLTVSPFGQVGPIMPVGPQLRDFDRLMPGGVSMRGPERGPERGFERGPEPMRTLSSVSERGPEPAGPGRPVGMFDWLQRNRASVRLETIRQQERAFTTARPVHGGVPSAEAVPPEGPREAHGEGPHEIRFEGPREARGEGPHEGRFEGPREGRLEITREGTRVTASTEAGRIRGGHLEVGRIIELGRREDPQAISPDRALPVLRPVTVTAPAYPAGTTVCEPISQPLMPGVYPGNVPVCAPPPPPPPQPNPSEGGTR